MFTIIAFASLLFTLGFGVYDISLVDAVSVFFDHILGKEVYWKDDLYIWNTRLPRAIAAVCVGAGLSVAGAVMQNDFRNPLAEPYTMGLSSGAFFGAVLSIALNISIIPGYTGNIDVANAFVLSLVPTAIIIVVTKLRKLTPTAMILVGVAIMFLFSSMCQIILVTSPSETLADAYNWRVGSLSRIKWESIPVMVSFTTVIIMIFWALAGKMDVMYAGDRGAQSLGVKAEALRIVTLILCSFLTAAIVSYSGTIGFIGLVGPHIARIFVGSSNRYLIPASAAFGATFVILADTLAKEVGASGLPVGVISSMVGGPLFIYILVRQKKSAWA